MHSEAYARKTIHILPQRYTAASLEKSSRYPDQLLHPLTPSSGPPTARIVSNANMSKEKKNETMQR